MADEPRQQVIKSMVKLVYNFHTKTSILYSTRIAKIQVGKATEQVRSEWKIEEGEEREMCLGGIGCQRRDQGPNFLWGEVQGTRQGIIQSL